MLTAQRSLLQSELETLQAAVSVASESKNQNVAQQTTYELERRVNATARKKNETIEAAVNARNKCMQKLASNNSRENEEGTEEDPCAQFEKSADSIEEKTVENAGATADLSSATFLLKSNQQYITFMQSRMTALEREISEINTQLNNLQADQVYLGDIADSINDLKEKAQQSIDQWTKFDYNSETSHMRSTEITFGLNFGIKGSVEVPEVAKGSGSFNAAFNFAEMHKAFNSANLQASGELLRVFIKRPWFKPSLFDNPTLNFVSWELVNVHVDYLSKELKRYLIY